MKLTKKKIYFYLFIFMFNLINCQLQRPPLFKCIHDDEEEKHSFSATKVKLSESFKRRIDEEQTSDFVDFKIHLDFKNLEKDMKAYGLYSQKDFFENSMIKAVETLQSLLKVKPLKITNNEGYNINDQTLTSEQFNLSDWDTEKFGDEAINKKVTFQSLNIHLVIFGILTKLPESTLATASAKVYQDNDGQPLVGIVKINKAINYTKPNSDIYFESILVHEFTHILGFSHHFFETYFHNIFSRIDKFGVNRTYLNSPKVLEVAKQYFDCPTIDGVELENQGGSGTAGSHWEARILLGEYMNGYAYTEEQVISEFTLAVLEDSGYYKPIKYTGGLMRFGKHKGCAFLEEKCVDKNTHKINPSFENEFYDTISDGQVIEASCSSGRQSRTYNAWWLGYGLPEEFQYFENPNITGYEPADFCPVPLKHQPEEDQSYFAGHCSIKGSGIYGSMISYRDINPHLSKDLAKYTGENLTDHSLCYLSSLSTDTKVSKVVRANCYETFCSDKSLTVKIFDDYIVCPKTGGKIEVDGYYGYLLCPDYNLMCSGSVVCNNIFDCVDKQSLLKEDSYKYDYEILTSQNIEKANDAEANDTSNYELSQNGICPEFCQHCKENNVCLKCVSGYIKKQMENGEIICSLEVDVKNGYYKNKNNVYLKCMEKCTICEDAKTCSKCEEGYYYHEKKCKLLTNETREKMVENCLEMDDNFNCKKCVAGYGFNQTNTKVCLKVDEELVNYYSKNNGVNYYPCSSINANWTKCFFNLTELRVKGIECKDNLVLLDKRGGLCLTKEEIEENPKYYFRDETHAGVCSKDIELCLLCNSANDCTQCSYKNYVFDNIQNKCVPLDKTSNSEGSGKSTGDESSSKNANNTNTNKETSSANSKKKKVKKKKDSSSFNIPILGSLFGGSNYFSIQNIIMLEMMYILFLLIKF